MEIVNTNQGKLPLWFCIHESGEFHYSFFKNLEYYESLVNRDKVTEKQTVTNASDTLTCYIRGIEVILSNVTGEISKKALNVNDFFNRPESELDLSSILPNIYTVDIYVHRNEERRHVYSNIFVDSTDALLCYVSMVLQSYHAAQLYARSHINGEAVFSNN